MIFWTENTEQNNTNKKINAKFKTVNLIFFPAINISPQLNSFLSNWKGWIIFINLFAREPRLVLLNDEFFKLFYQIKWWINPKYQTLVKKKKTNLFDVNFLLKRL